jgi:hypothetical protein
VERSGVVNETKEAFVAQRFVASEMRRMIERMGQLDPSTYDYKQLLENLSVLTGSIEAFEDIESYLSLADQGITAIDIYPEGKPETEEDEPESGEDSDEAPIPEPEPEPAPTLDPEPEPGKTYEMSEVRTALVAARRKGTNVTELLREFGVENFSAFPAGRYGELMRKLGAE